MKWKEAAVIALLLVAPHYAPAAERTRPLRTVAPGV
jgi:hypothetical protein